MAASTHRTSMALRGLEEGRRTSRPHRQVASSRRARPHRLGDAHAPQGRPPSHVPGSSAVLSTTGAVCPVCPPSEVTDVADRFKATPFDIEVGYFWGVIRGETCTFDTMIEEFGLKSAPLLAACQDRARAPIPPAPISRRSRRACSPRHSAIRACTGRISRNSRRRWFSTTRSSAGVVTPAKRRTTGPAPNRKAEMNDTAVAGEPGRIAFAPAHGVSPARSLLDVAARGVTQFRRPCRADRGDASNPRPRRNDGSRRNGSCMR